MRVKCRQDDGRTDDTTHVGSREAAPRQVRGTDSQAPGQTHRSYAAVERRRLRPGRRYRSHGRESGHGVHRGGRDRDRRALQRSVTHVDGEHERERGRGDTRDHQEVSRRGTGAS